MGKPVLLSLCPKCVPRKGTAGLAGCSLAWDCRASCVGPGKWDSGDFKLMVMEAESKPAAPAAAGLRLQPLSTRRRGGCCVLCWQEVSSSAVGELGLRFPLCK